jgi:hypothetical protein
MWSKAKNGLIQSSKQGRTSPFFYIAKMRKFGINKFFANYSFQNTVFDKTNPTGGNPVGQGKSERLSL